MRDEQNKYLNLEKHFTFLKEKCNTGSLAKEGAVGVDFLNGY